MEYIERYWRDATPEDAIKEPPMVARFRNHNSEWSIQTLNGYNRKLRAPWGGDEWWYDHCQVYDAPDPGEGWRLIDVEKEEPQEGDEIYYPMEGTWQCRKSPFKASAKSLNRRRIEPPKPKYVPFAWEDREQLRGRWITYKHQDGSTVETQVNQLTEHRNEGFLFKSRNPKWLLENATFLDTGEPVGRKVME